MDKGFTVWLAGLPGSGKTIILFLLEKRLKEYGLNVEVLDDNVVSENLTQNPDVTQEDPIANSRQVAFVCKLLTRNGVAVISAAASPSRECRDDARKEIGSFIEVFVKCPPETCAGRNVKGLYDKAVKGVTYHFEEPLNPEVVIETDKESVEESTDKILNKLMELGYLNTNVAVSKVHSTEEEKLIMERLSRLGYL